MGEFKYEEWWEKNKKRYNENRRQRWREDPEYRDKVRSWGKKSRDKEVDERSKASSIRRSATREPEEVQWGKLVLMAYGTDVLARYIGRSKTTIYSWEHNGWMPRTPLLSSRGEKLYTPGMMKVVRDVVRKFEKKGLSRGKAKVDGDKMREQILAGWMKMRDEGEPNVRLNFKKMISVPEIETRKIDVNGKEEEAYTTEVLARAVARSRYQMPIWEKDGYLPETPFRSARNWRLYTKEMILVVKEAMDERVAPDKEMYEEIVAGWLAVGIEPCNHLHKEREDGEEGNGGRGVGVEADRQGDSD